MKWPFACLEKHGVGLSLPESSPPGTGSVALGGGIGVGSDGHWPSVVAQGLSMWISTRTEDLEGRGGRAGNQWREGRTGSHLWGSGSCLCGVPSWLRARQHRSGPAFVPCPAWVTCPPLPVTIESHPITPITRERLSLPPACRTRRSPPHNAEQHRRPLLTLPDGAPSALPGESRDPAVPRLVPCPRTHLLACMVYCSIR